MRHTFELFHEDLNKDSIPAVGSVGPQERNIISATLRNILESGFPIEQLNQRLLRGRGDAVNVLAFTGSTKYSNGISTEDPMLDLGFVQQFIEVDCGIIKAGLNHFQFDVPQDDSRRNICVDKTRLRERMTLFEPESRRQVVFSQTVDHCDWSSDVTGAVT